MHVETYPAFFTPRDKEPSLSSSEEKSSKFGWLERKLTRKQEKQSKCSVLWFYIWYIYLYWITWFSILCPENKLPRAIYKENYKTKYLRLFTLFPNLITKESYGWWITRRRMEIYTQISEGKYPKVSVVTIGKLQENTRALCKMAAKSFRSKRVISQPCKILPSTMMQLSCKGHIILISAPIRTPFKALDSWLLELRNGI